MPSSLLKDVTIDEDVFDIFFRHHLRWLCLSVSEYSKIMKLDEGYVYNVSIGKSKPNITILKDMGILNTYKGIVGNYCDDKRN